VPVENHRRVTISCHARTSYAPRAAQNRITCWARVRREKRLKQGALSRQSWGCMYMENAAQQRPILGRLCSLFPLMCVCRPHALSLPTARNNKFRSSGGGGGRVNCNLSVSCSAGDEWSYHLCMFSPLRTITSPSPCRTHLHTRERPNLSAEQKQCDNKQQLQSEFLCRSLILRPSQRLTLGKRLLPRGSWAIIYWICNSKLFFEVKLCWKITIETAWKILVILFSYIFRTIRRAAS
jgi:hypothetical protein